MSEFKRVQLKTDEGITPSVTLLDNDGNELNYFHIPNEADAEELYDVLEDLRITRDALRQRVLELEAENETLTERAHDALAHSVELETLQPAYENMLVLIRFLSINNVGFRVYFATSPEIHIFSNSNQVVLFLAQHDYEWEAIASVTMPPMYILVEFPTDSID